MPIEVTSYQPPRRRKRLTGATEVVRRRARAARIGGIIFRVAVAAVVVAAVAAVSTFAYFYHSYSKVVDRQLAAGYLRSRAGVYAAPRVLRPGASLSRERLVDALRRAGYVEGNTSDVWNGNFAVAENQVEIRPRQGGGAPEAVRVAFGQKTPDRIASIEADGAQIGSFTLEPELLSSDDSMKIGAGATLGYKDIPPVLARAILAIEDRRFFEHNGVDFSGVVRALLRNTNTGRAAQGGSTITQQLVKNVYLTPEKSLRRKFNEAVLASVLERRLSKEDILALYCNEIYLGQRGATAVRGVEQAARVYFGKDLRDLSLAEAATIAGMIQSPNRHAPEHNPEGAKNRRNQVLAAMLRDGAISAREAEQAGAEEMVVVSSDAVTPSVAPYFIDYVNRIVESQLEVSGNDDARELRVHTTLDLELQEHAEQVVREKLDALDKVYRRGGKEAAERPQAALIAVDPHNGHVLAMVGGRDYAESQLNRVTDARRQPGSVFKPFVYAAALEAGMSPLSATADAPRTFTYDGRRQYKPANYGGGYSMRDVTMRDALVRSLNVVTVDVALRAGLSRVASFAEKAGLPRPEPYPSLALGTTEVTPLEIAGAYTSFANGGEAVSPIVLTGAVDAGGDPAIARMPLESRRVVRPETAYMLTDMMGDVIARGTARAARGSVKGAALAGKTGTSRDGWFVGYTPNLICAVWVGFDDNKQLGLTGAEAALPVWTAFMKGAVGARPELGGAAFLRPAGITSVEIDPETGMLAAPSCPAKQRVALASNFAPAGVCLTHTEQPAMLLAAEDSLPADAAIVAAAAVSSEATSDTQQPIVQVNLPAPTTLAIEAVDRSSSAAPTVKPVSADVGENGRRVLTNDLHVTEEQR